LQALGETTVPAYMVQACKHLSAPGALREPDRNEQTGDGGGQRRGKAGMAP